MATFKVVVLPHQKKEDGTYNVKIRITQARKSKYIKTSQFVSAQDISRKKEKGVEKIKIKNQAIIDLMDELVLSYRRKLTAAGIQAESWDVDKIVEYLTGSSDGFYLNIIQYGKDYADSLEKQARTGTAKSYRVAMNALERFAGPDLDVNQITVSFLKSYERFLREEPTLCGTKSGGVVTTDKPKAGRAVSSYISFLKTVFNNAKLEYNDEEAGIVRIPLSPFSKYKIPEVTVSVEHRVLSVEQIQHIIDLPYVYQNKNKGYSLFNIAKDVFLISFALMGMNTADLYEACEYSGYVLTYQRRKTRTRRKDKALIKVFVEPEIRPLIEKYRGNGTVFCFSDHYVTSDMLNAMVNIGLKRIGREIGVPDLNFYYARHSMASICANKLGIDIARVDEMLNHSDPKLSLARVYIEKDFRPLWVLKTVDIRSPKTGISVHFSYSLPMAMQIY